MDWQEAFDAELEICAVQLPGRGVRIAEQPYTVMPALVADLSAAIDKDSPMPFAFFGHSLGGLLAFELARYRLGKGLSMPAHLIVSGCSAPQARPASRGMHKMEDAELIGVLREYNGTPREVLDHRELISLLLPTIRADFLLAEEYTYRPAQVLDIPITVFAGTGDPYCSPEAVDQWRKETHGPVDIHAFEGDHFFIQSNRAAVLNRLAKTLPVKATNAYTLQ